MPEGFAADTVTREGEAARTWLARLPELVGELCVRWGLRVTGDPMHGYMALVVPALRGDARCALKVSWIDDETVNEAAALALWNGGGAVRLLDADDTAGALLLEWLDPRRRLAEADLSVAVPVAGRLLRRLAVPVPAGWPGRPVPGLRQWALDLAAELPRRWRATGRPFPERRLDAAVEVAAALAPRAGGLLANRDMHYQNVLAGEREPWLVIDPKVMRGDAEFGLAPLLWRRLGEAGGPAGLRRRFDALVDEAGFDAELARGWTLLRAVDYQLWGLSLGLAEDPARCATVLGWLSLTGRP
ncbi:MAG TPA: aminoglycoside phosphotransferase family protein [Streptosporangiaceae bacterium]|nr:aminoglycoside phosphotransferase family protein [Streptosporangiaceae bacterium]